MLRCDSHAAGAACVLAILFCQPALLQAQAAHDAAPADDLPRWRENRRSEEESDRVHAAALAAMGRLHFQRQDYVRALRYYQRAWRYDGELLDPLREIVPLAFALNRGAEATRYAVLAAEEGSSDPRLLEQLGDYLAARGEWERADRFYERALRYVPDTHAARRVVLWNKQGRLRFLAGDFAAASGAFERLAEALDKLSAEGERQQAGAEETADMEPENQLAQLLAEKPRAFRLIGEAFLQAGKTDRAETMFRRAEQAETPQQPSRLAWQLARVAAARQDWPAARRHWEQFGREPAVVSGAEPFQLLRKLLLRETGDEKTAREQTIARLEQRRRETPGDTELADYLATLHVEAGQTDKALAVYEQALRQNDDETLRSGLVRVALQSGDWERALAALGGLIAAQQSLQPVAAELQELARDEERVAPLLRTASRLLESDKLTETAALGAGRIAILAGRFDAAGSFFERALDEKGVERADVFVLWALSLLTAEQHEAAAVVFQRALREDAVAEQAEETYFLLAGALALAGKTEEALRASKRAAALRPDSAEFASRVAWIHYEAGQDEAAVRAYRQVLRRWDQETAEETRQVLLEARRVLSNLSLRLGDDEQAVEWLEQVLDEFPEDPGALNDLGYLWADRNQHLKRALRMIRQAVAADPENRAYRDSLGWVYYRLGRHRAALRELRQATAGESADGEILDHLGEVYWALGEREQASRAWRRARDAFQRDQQPDRAEAVEAKRQRRENEP